MKELQLFCHECVKKVKTHFTDGGDNWFSSWHCIECEGELAREKDNRFVVWTGREFNERSKPQ